MHPVQRRVLCRNIPFFLAYAAWGWLIYEFLKTI